MTKQTTTTNGLRIAGSVLALAVGAAPGIAFAQASDNSPAAEANDSYDIIVTAQKREQRLTDVPVSVVAISGETIRDRNVHNLADLSTYIPNFTYTKGGQVNIITIRGIGTAGTDGFESSVGVYVDDVYVPKARNASMPLYDLERAEVLRGPQGVLFGKNSIAGVLNLTTARPTDKPYFAIDARGGSYGWFEGTVVASGPVTDTLSLRFAAYGGRRDGYIHNDTPGRSDGRGFETYGGRLSAHFHPSDAFTLYGKLEYFVDNEIGMNRQLENIGPADLANPAFAGVESRLDDHQISGTTGIFDVDNKNGPHALVGELQGSYRFDSGTAITATFGYNDFDQHISRTDALPINTILQANPNDIRTVNLELRLATPVENRLSFIGGIYGEDTTLHTRGISALFSSGIYNGVRGSLLGLGAPAAKLPADSAIMRSATAVIPGKLSRTHLQSVAAFGELRFRATDRLSIVGGLRYSYDRQNIAASYAPEDANGNPLGSAASIAAILPDPDYLLANGKTLLAAAQPIYQNLLGLLTKLPGSPALSRRIGKGSATPSARIEYKPDADTLFYGSFQTGFKQGGFNDAVSSLTPFGPERATAFEIGAKRVFDFGLSVDLALFRSRFRDLQVSAVNVANGSSDTFNAASAISQGIELDARWRIDRSWSLAASYAYLDAHYKNFPNAPCSIDQLVAKPTGTCIQDLRGRRLFNAPRNSASMQLDYQHDFGALTGGFSLVGTYKSRYFTEITDSAQLAADSTRQLDGRVFVGRDSQGWQAEIGVSNIFDRRVAVLRQRPALVADPRTWTATINQPRMAYVRLNYRF